MVLTKELVRKYFTKKYTKDMARFLGEPWPLRAGWRERLVGREISEDTWEAFIALACSRAVTPGQWCRMLKYVKHALRLPSGTRVAGINQAILALHPDAPTGRKECVFWFFEKHGGRSAIRENVEPKWRERSQRAPEPHLDEFLRSYSWRRLRMEIIKERGARCECCGSTPTDGVTVINVDHIKPRKTHPDLALEKSNLQVLCHVCNHGKGNWDSTDWRKDGGRRSTVSVGAAMPDL